MRGKAPAPRLGSGLLSLCPALSDAQKLRRGRGVGVGLFGDG